MTNLRVTTSVWYVAMYSQAWRRGGSRMVVRVLTAYRRQRQRRC